MTYTVESLQEILDTSTEQLGYRKVPALHKDEVWGWFKWIKLTPKELELEKGGEDLDLEQHGDPIWISEARFHLVPNEHIEAAIRLAALKRGAKELSRGTGTRWSWGDRGPWQWYGYFDEDEEDAAGLGKVKRGFWVANAMDGTLGLTFGGIAEIVVDGKLLHDRFTVYSHRHTANVVKDPIVIASLVDKSLTAVSDWAKYVATLHGKDPRNALPIMERLAAIPQKYTPDYLHRDEDTDELNPNAFPPDLLEVYKDVLAGLAVAKDVREDTIVGHHDKLHAALEYLTVLQSLKAS